MLNLLSVGALVLVMSATDWTHMHDDNSLIFQAILRYSPSEERKKKEEEDKYFGHFAAFWFDTYCDAFLRH